MMDASLQTVGVNLLIVLQAGPHIDIAAGADQGTNWGFVGTLFVGVLALAALSAVGYFIWRFVQSRSSASGKSAGPVKLISKETRRRVKKATDRGQFETAGDLLAQAGAHEDASQLYVEAGSFLKAARSLDSTGNRAQAIHLYKRAGDVEQAARLYAEDGQPRAAAAEYLQAGDHAAAAAQYAQAGDHRRAAKAYRKADDTRRAARQFDKAGDALEAAASYVAYFEEQLAESDAPVEQLDRARASAKRGACLLKEAGEAQRAGEIFRRAGFLGRAAACFEDSGQTERASTIRAKTALESGDTHQAAKMFASAGQLEQAADLFDQLDDAGSAAPLYQQSGDHERASELFEQLKNYGSAARCAEAAGQLSRAADLYGQAGDVDSEIRLLDRQGDHFRAGRVLFEHRRFQAGLDALAQIDSADPIYPRALELAGDIYQAQGRFEKAYSRYRSAIGEREAEASTLPLFYKMARALEQAQDLTGAMDHYNAIVDVDPHFEDAQSRLDAARRRLQRGSVAGTTSSGIFSTSDEVQGMLSARYEIIEEIARGGMGIVSKARDTVLGRVVALKSLGENLRDNEMAVRYFLREARAAAALSHPNIVTIYDAGEQDGTSYMAMEFVEGTTLKQMVQNTGALDEPKIRDVLTHCCRALDYAHSKGVIHRDIKSGNVMMTHDEDLKIMDFGLAKFLREYQKEHTQQVGTPFYMSPEQIIGEEIDFRSDLYGLGCTIFECATGEVPFHKGDLSYHHLHTEPPRPRQMNPELSTDMEDIILTLLAKSPDERYQSASAILELVGDA